MTSLRRSLFVACAALLAGSGCGAARSSQPPTGAGGPTQASGSRGGTVSFPDLVGRVRSGVIRLEASTCAGTSVGTGFLVGPRLVATVEHVVDGATGITLKSGPRLVGTGTVIGEDTARDVALVRASRPLSGYVFQLATRAPRLGESVAALGFPLGLPLTVTRGSVSGTDRTIPIAGVSRQRLVQTDAAINPGNSGGPLLSTANGDVVGLVDIGTERANGLGFAVSAEVSGPLFAAWRTAPQPIPAATCGAPPLPHPTGSQTVPPPSNPTPTPAGDWPAGQTGYTIVLASETDRSRAQQAIDRARASGLPAGLLYSSDHASLNPGYWVAFSGSFSSMTVARASLAAVHQAGFSDAYPRYVSGQ